MITNRNFYYKWKFWIISYLVIALLTAWIPARGEAQNWRTVRVGVFELGSFHNMDAQGEAYGYDVDYLRRMQQQTHWKIEYVQTQNWTEALQFLDQGKIDLVAPAQKTAEREKKYLFSANSMSTEFGAVQTLAKRDDLIYEDFDTMASLHYGALKNSPLTDHFVDSYAPEAGFTPKITYYEDMTVMYQALYDGKVDAIATNIMLGDDRVKMIGRYSPSPVFYIARKDAMGEQLMTELDDAMTDVMLQSPEFQTELFAKYFSGFRNTQLTQSEKDFVKSLPKITVGYEINHAPLSYQDKKTGEFKGITRDILDRISELSGIQFQYEPLPANDVSYQYLKEHKIYVFANVEYNDVNTSITTMHMSRPYLSSEKVLVAKKGLQFDSESALNLALASGSDTLTQIIAQAYPNFKLTNYQTVDECFDDVVSGKMDASMQNRYVAESLMTNPAYDDLTVIPIQSLEDDLCLATMEYQLGTSIEEKLNSGEFISIIDKTVTQISSKEINKLIIQNTSEARYHSTVWDTLKEYRFVIMAMVILLAGVLVLMAWKQKVEMAKGKELSYKNNELRDAVRQAERANQAKSAFLSRMSHEIRTPMNAIVGITTIAKQHKEDPDMMEGYLNKISDSSHVLLNIINDVLDMSAIENEKLKMGYSEFDMKEVLNNIANIFYHQCQEKGVALVMGTDIDHEVVIGDSLRVNQILANLVSNAIKFTEPGGKIRIDATEKTVQDKVVYLRFEVSDTGCGMSKDMRDRMYLPFEQESAQTAQEHGGSGLGLSITKNLVDLMHGAITVESELGKGTHFTVDIPFEFTENQDGINPEKFKELRALIVDDDEAAAEYTSIVLKRIGVQFDVSHSGEDALNRVTSEYNKGSGYDVCFLDWKMPGMSGVDLTEKLRGIFDNDTLIIIISGFDLSAIEEDAKKAGADVFVTKPLFQSTVFNLLMNLSGGRYVKSTSEDLDEYDFTGHRVLMAEDVEMNREIATDLLDMVNMEVDCVPNGQKAVEQFEASEVGTYDLILMDIQMPILNGLDATKRIRSGSHPEAKSIPIFALTANAFSEDISASLNAGMNGHIAKPIDTDVLYRTLQKVISDQEK